jgi:hypothetical protein
VSTVADGVIFFLLFWIWIVYERIYTFFSIVNGKIRLHSEKLQN